MAIPTPDSLIAFVKPELDTSESFIAKLSAKMSNETVVKDSYRGNGIFTFYIEGYMLGTGILETEKALEVAGYKVIRFEQKAGYLPPDWWHDISSAGHGDLGVTGNSTTPWFLVSISKVKVVE